MAEFSSEDIKFMSMAISTAKKGLGRTAPNPAVGAVIIKDGNVVGTGYHKKAGSAHAEVNAIQNAGELARDATMYVTLEPCNHKGKTPPCTEAVLKAGIKKVVIGVLDPNPKVQGGGMNYLEKHRVKCLHGCLETEAMLLVAPFAKHAVSGIPWIISKTACSMDGNVATRTGHSKWITNSKAREYGHRLRDIVDAILVGRGTAEVDNPSLTCRIKDGRDPKRIVMDSYLKCSPDLKLFNQKSSAVTILACLENVSDIKKNLFKKKGVKILELPPDKIGKIDVKVMLAKLGSMGVQSILLEGGSTLQGSFWDNNLVDEVYFFYAPKIIGGEKSKTAIGGMGVEKASEAHELFNLRHEKIDDNWLVSGIVTGHLYELWKR